jgi:hypothetical protein
MGGFTWTFEVADDAAFDRLVEAVAALRAAKLSGDWRNFSYWEQVFSGAQVAWGLSTLLDCFEDGEFVLVGVRREALFAGLTDIGIEPLDYGYLDFDPSACPYSGDCMGQLIEAFGHRDLGGGLA